MALLDSCSEATYLSKKVANKLKLKLNICNNIDLKVCGIENKIQKLSYVVLIYLNLKYGIIMSLKVNTIDKIVSKIKHVE